MTIAVIDSDYNDTDWLVSEFNKLKKHTLITYPTLSDVLLDFENFSSADLIISEVIINFDEAHNLRGKTGKLELGDDTRFGRCKKNFPELVNDNLVARNAGLMFPSYLRSKGIMTPYILYTGIDRNNCENVLDLPQIYYCQKDIKLHDLFTTIRKIEKSA